MSGSEYHTPLSEADGTARRQVISSAALEAIRSFDTCTIANAIERFGLRLRNEGYTRPGLRAVTGGCPRILGYAVTFQIRSSDPPMTGNAYMDRTDWWNSVSSLPGPKVAVIQTLDPSATAGSAAGSVHAAILQALGCEGLITNGPVRDLPALQALNFPVLAPCVTVSHAYTHLVSFGSPVEIFGLQLRTGDLLYGDCHGAVSIPLRIAERVPDAAQKLRASEQRILDFCQSDDFNPATLMELITRTERE